MSENYSVPVALENLERKFHSIINTNEWKRLQEVWNESENILYFGHGGNMGISDHAAIDASRLTDKNIIAPGSGVLTTSIISDNDFHSWAKHWVEIRTRHLDKSKCLVVGFSCSSTGTSSDSIVNALNWSVEHGMKSALFTAQPKEGLNKSIIPITQHCNYYHTSEIISLMLTYELIHRAGFPCPTIANKARLRRFESLGIDTEQDTKDVVFSAKGSSSEIETKEQHVPPGFEGDLKNIAVDFDGVIHNFDKGWHDGTCYGEPLPGSLEALKKLSETYRVIIFSSKVRPDRPLVDGKTGYELVMEWLIKYEVDKYVDEVTYEKPRAQYYIDDKAIEFTTWDKALKDVL